MPEKIDSIVPDLARAAQGTPASWASGFRGWSTVAVFFVAAILSYTDRLIFSLIVDPVRTSLGISDFQVGLAQGTSFAVVYALAGLPAGRMADIANRRRLLLIGVFTWSIGTIACGFATDLASLVSARIIVAAGEAVLAPAAISIISDLFPPERRGRPTAVFLSGMNVGSGLALVIGGGVLTFVETRALAFPGLGQLEPWRMTLVLIGLGGLPMLLLLLLVGEPSRRESHQQQKRPFTAVLQDLRSSWKRLVPLFGALAGMATVDFAVISWVPTLLSRDFGVSAWKISNGFGSVVLICGLLGTLVGGLVADRLFVMGGNALRLKFAALLALAGGVSIAFLTIAPAEIVVALSGFWLFVSAVATICGISTAQDMVPADAKGLCISLIAMGNISLGLGIGASLPGALTGGVAGGPSGLSWAIAVVAVPVSLMAAFLFSAKNDKSSKGS